MRCQGGGGGMLWREEGLIPVQQQRACAWKLGVYGFHYIVDVLRKPRGTVLAGGSG